MAPAPAKKPLGAARSKRRDIGVLLGAHMSVAGGLPLAVDRAVAHRCDAFQIFSKNANQWRGRTVPPEEVHEFRARWEASGIGPVVSHASYLINLATTSQSPQWRMNWIGLRRSVYWGSSCIPGAIRAEIVPGVSRSSRRHSTRC